MSTSITRLLPILLLSSSLAACGLLADPINDEAREENDGGGPGQYEPPLGIVEAVIGGEHRVFSYRTGGVTPDRYTVIVAEDGHGQELEISFDGNAPGTYSCGASARTSVEYAADTMQATSGTCTIEVAEVGDLAEPIRGTFSARLTIGGGQGLDVTDGYFDVTNEIP